MGKKRSFAGIPILFVAILLILGLASASYSAEMKLRLSHPSQPNTPVAKSFETFKSIVEKESNGQLKIDIFGAGVLGQEVEMAEQLLIGQVDIAVLATTNFSGRSNSFLVFDLPFVFQGQEEWRWQMGGYEGTGGQILSEIREYVLKKDNVALLGCEGPGKPKSIGNTKKPVQTPEDAKGLKIRVSASPIEAGLIKAWGFVPVPIPWPEVYSALAQKVVDGTVTDYLVGGQMGQFELLKYVIEPNAVQSAYIILMNGNKWKSLAPGLQDVVLKAAAAGTRQCWAEVDAVVEEYKQKWIREQHIQVYVPTPEVYKQWEKIALDEIWPKYVPTVDQNVYEIVKKYRAQYQEYLKTKK